MSIGSKIILVGKMVLDMARCGISFCYGISLFSIYRWGKFNVGYFGAGFDYFSKGFVHTPDQNEIEADQDKTRRALSNALFTSSLALFQTGGKLHILQKNYEKIIYFLKCRARFAHTPDQNL